MELDFLVKLWTDNSGENIPNKLKKSGKIRQGKKTCNYLKKNTCNYIFSDSY